MFYLDQYMRLKTSDPNVYMEGRVIATGGGNTTIRFIGKFNHKDTVFYSEKPFMKCYADEQLDQEVVRG